MKKDVRKAKNSKEPAQENSTCLPGYFSLIQAAQHERKERVNVGVVLICPATGYVCTWVDDSFSRSIRVFRYSAKRLRDAVSAICDVLERQSPSLEQLTLYSLYPFNELRFTTPSPVSVIKGKEDKMLQLLFEKLVL